MEQLAPTVLALPGPEPSWSMRRHHAHLSDEALVALVARGDEPALAELYDRVGRVAYGLAFRVLRDDRLAEDAVQEAFSPLADGGAFRAERAKASTWILTLVHRRAVDLVRREERRRTNRSPTTCRSAPAGTDADRRGGMAALRARTRPGGAQAVAGRTARGDRARVLRRLHPVRARGEARPAARHDQEPDVRRARAPSRATRRSTQEGSWKPELRADGGLRPRRPRARRARRVRGAPGGLRGCQEELASLSSVTEALAVAASGSGPEPGTPRAGPGGGAGRAAGGRALRAPAAGAWSPCLAAVRPWPQWPPSRSGSGRHRSRETWTMHEPRSSASARQRPFSPIPTPEPLRSRRVKDRLVVGQDGRAVLVLDGLDPAPAGKTYEMWIVESDRTLPAGLFPGHESVRGRARRRHRRRRATSSR